MGQANIWFLLLSLVGIYASYLIRAIRWRQFSTHFGEAGLAGMFSATIMGFAAIFVLGRPGEPVRPLLLARKSRLPVSSMFGIWVLERLFDAGAAIVLASLSLLVFSGSLVAAGANSDWLDNARAAGWALLGVLVLGVALMVYFRRHGAGALERRLECWRGAGSWRGRTATIVTGFSDGLQAIRSVSDLSIAIAYTAALWFIETLIYLLIAQAFSGNFGYSMNFPGAMLLLAVTLLGATLQLPGVGGGAQVASFIALTTIFGVEQEPAVAVAVVLWLITFAASTVVGVPLLIHEGLSVGELRKLAKAETYAEESGEHLPLVGVGQPARPGPRNGRKSGEIPR